jgi:triosephosphate isomerase
MPPLIAGNWKMNATLGEARQLLEGILAGALPTSADLLVLPPFTALETVARILRETGAAVALGAQDLHWEPRGAFTGEVSGPMLRDLGCRYVLVGHSERRTHFGESGETLRRKLAAALRDDLVPILCVGERRADREAGATESVLRAQLEESLWHMDAEGASRTILAYEPVWAIGTGVNATPEQAEEAHAFVRRRLSERFGEAHARDARILYGGSVTPANAAGLLARPGIDGALVGGASLKARDFLGIAACAPEPGGRSI